MIQVMGESADAVDARDTEIARLKAVLAKIVEDAPESKPPSKAGGSYAGTDDDWALGWDLCHWRLAQIARKAFVVQADTPTPHHPSTHA